MNLIPFRTYRDVGEYEMQREVTQFFQDKITFYKNANNIYFRELIKHVVYNEVRIPEVGRISDIIIKVTDKKVFNIECKLGDHTAVLQQAKDHLKWADYSYICISAGALIPNHAVLKIMREGIGLLFWRPGMIDEILMSYKSGKVDKQTRVQVLKRLKEIDAINTGAKEANQLLI